MAAAGTFASQRHVGWPDEHGTTRCGNVVSISPTSTCTIVLYAHAVWKPHSTRHQSRDHLVQALVFLRALLPVQVRRSSAKSFSEAKYESLGVPLATLLTGGFASLSPMRESFNKILNHQTEICSTSQMMASTLEWRHSSVLLLPFPMRPYHQVSSHRLVCFKSRQFLLLQPNMMALAYTRAA